MKKMFCFMCVVLCLMFSMNLSLADGNPNITNEEVEGLVDCDDQYSDEENSCMYVTGHPFVYLRQTDSTSKPYVAKMPYGSMVTVIATQTNDIGEEWSFVTYNGSYGFCMTEYLSYEIDISADETCPLTMTEAFGTSLLQRGNSTPSYTVKNLQLCLITGGFLNDSNGVDGYFGKNTHKALCAFQRSQGLEPVGRAGNTTKTRLWYLYADFLRENGVMQ